MKTQFLEVYDYLYSLVRNGRDGDRLPSQKELTYKFQVCHLTVRKAFKKLESEGHIHLKRGKGTFVKKNKNHKGHCDLFVVVPNRDLIADNFYHYILNGIVSRSRDFGSFLRIFHLPAGEHVMLDEIRTSTTKGLIWLVPQRDNYHILEELHDRGCEIVAINRIIRNSPIGYVSTDHEKGAFQLTSALLERGHKKIAFIGLMETLQFSSLRFKGFLRALQTSGIKFPSSALVKFPGKGVGFVKSKEGIRKTLKEFKPSALFCSQGAFMPYILDTVSELGIRFPGEIEIATFDDVPERSDEMRFVHQAIQPLRRLGELAVENIVDILCGKKGTLRLLIPPDISIKEIHADEDQLERGFSSELAISQERR